MIYNEGEDSLNLGRPVFCYQFVRAGHNSQDWSWYKITNRPLAVPGGVGNYLPESVTHSTVKQTKDVERNTVTITLPIENSYLQTLLNYEFDYSILVDINRAHLFPHSISLRAYWRGRVAEVSTGKGQGKIVCESIFTRLKQVGLRRNFQRGCPHPLYNTGCNLNRNNFVTNGTCTSGIGSVFQISGISGLPAGYLDGGIIRFGDEYRMIELSDGVSVNTARPMKELLEAIADSGSQPVQLYAGCDRTMQTCNDKFNNLLNFGGTPFIPKRNPLGGTSII